MKKTAIITTIVFICAVIIGSLTTPILQGKPTSSIAPTPLAIDYPTEDLNFYINFDEIDPKFKNIFTSIEKFMKSETKPFNTWLTQSGKIWWISEEKLDISIQEAYSLTANYLCKGTSSEEFQKAKQIFGPKTTMIMSGNGYKLNKTNSSSSLTDEQFYDYVLGYEKGDDKCTLTINSDCSGEDKSTMFQTITLACSDKYLATKSIQEPILKDLRYQNSIININGQIGNFANIESRGRRGGGYIIAMLKDGHWQELYAGQDLPSCAQMQKYQVPVELYSSCY